jgi:hypothetical protein
MSNETTFNFTPSLDVSPFAISYREISVATYNSEFNHILLYELLTKNEQELIGLKSNEYNLFTKYSDDKNIQDIVNHLLTNYEKYCILTNTMKEKIFIHAWCSITRKGTSINEHVHDLSRHSYLSGNLYVRGYDNKSETVYKIPTQNDNLHIDDTPCKLTLFPSWLLHQTNVYRGEQPRVSIGMNIYPMRFYEEMKQSENYTWIEHVYTP